MKNKIIAILVILVVVFLAQVIAYVPPGAH